jgi:hypothetical protein
MARSVRNVRPSLSDDARDEPQPDHGELAQHRGIFFILFLKYFTFGSLPPIPSKPPA